MEAVYPPQLCLSLDRIKSYWVQTMFLDRTCQSLFSIKIPGTNLNTLAYHCSMALMATLNEFVFASEAASSEAIYHLGQAISLVNQNLGSEEGLSNSSISVVNFLLIRNMFRDEQSGARIHLHGLREMLALRGGLSQLEDRTLVLKICK